MAQLRLEIGAHNKQKGLFDERRSRWTQESAQIFSLGDEFSEEDLLHEILNMFCGSL